MRPAHPGVPRQRRCSGPDAEATVEAGAGAGGRPRSGGRWRPARPASPGQVARASPPAPATPPARTEQPSSPACGGRADFSPRGGLSSALQAGSRSSVARRRPAPCRATCPALSWRGARPGQGEPLSGARRGQRGGAGQAGTTWARAVWATRTVLGPASWDLRRCPRPGGGRDTSHPAPPAQSP